MTLYIQGQRRSLRVEIDTTTGEFLFAGVSLPENTNSFFEPVLDEIKAYIKDPQPTTKINFFIEYLNTSSALFLRRIVMLCEEKLGAENLEVVWHYEKDDEDIKEFGEDFKSVFEAIEVTLKEIDANPYS